MQVLSNRELALVDEESLIAAHFPELVLPSRGGPAHQGKDPISPTPPIPGTGEPPKEALISLEEAIKDLLALARAEEERHRFLTLVLPSSDPRSLAEIQDHAKGLWPMGVSRVSQLLHELEERGQIHRFENSKVKGSLGRAQYLYSRKPKTPQEWEEAARLYLTGYIPPKVLGDAGEAYVRAIIKRSGYFERVTQAKRLGRVNVTKGQRNDQDKRRRDPLDLTFRKKGEPDTVYACEVKNNAECYSVSTKGVLKGLVEKALDYAESYGVLAVPVFVCPRMTHEAAKYAEYLGIATWQIQRQIIPKEYRLAALTRGFAGRFRENEIINTAHVFSQGDKGLSAAMRRDLRFVSAPAWLRNARLTWLHSQPITKQFLDTKRRLPSLTEIRVALRGPLESLLRVPFAPLNVLTDLSYKGDCTALYEQSA